MDERFEAARRAFFDGLACQQAGDFAAAEAHYRQSLAQVPGRASTLTNLAATLLRLGRPQEALARADEALAAEAVNAEALLHRATALAQLGRAPQALAAFERLLSLDASVAPAWSFKGSLLRELGRLDEAAQAFREALRRGADPELNAYYLAAVQPGPAPAASPASYVLGLFDSYADDFDQHLVSQLHYQGHQRLVDALLARAAGPWPSALDLGCGTGLCGPLVRPRVGRLTGVDLSERMLARAQERGVYDRLVAADVVAHLRQSDEVHHLMLAADVFIYLGDLAPLFEAAAARLAPGGLFAFSVELVPPGGPDFRLQPSLRYAHARGYLLRLAAQHGFTLVGDDDAPVRNDQQAAVAGLYMVLRRAEAAG